MTGTPSGAHAAVAVHAFVPASYANGPGRRAVLWLQGCTLACPGCFNPETHPFASGPTGARTPVRELADRMAAADGIEGLTISGGEPLQQRSALDALLAVVRAETDLSIILFTGYAWDELTPAQRDLLRHVDVVIAGPYDQGRRVATGLRGSANKTVHLLTDRYTMADIDAVPPAEIVIDAAGGLVLSGIQPISMSNSPTSITPA